MGGQHVCSPQGVGPVDVAVDVQHGMVSWPDTNMQSAELELNIIGVARFSRILSPSFCIQFCSLGSPQHMVVLCHL